MAERTTHDESTRQRFIDTTIELIDEVGVDRVRLHEVLSRSGLSNGSLYWFFKNRRSLIDAALAERYVRRLRAGTADARRHLDERSSVGRLEDFIAPLVTPFVGDLADVRSERIAVLAGALADPRLAERVLEMQNGLLDEVATVIEAQQASGFLRDDVDATAIAQFIQVIAVGLASLDLHPDRELVAARWAQIATVVLAAFQR